MDPCACAISEPPKVLILDLRSAFLREFDPRRLCIISIYLHIYIYVYILKVTPRGSIKIFHRTYGMFWAVSRVVGFTSV